MSSGFKAKKHYDIGNSTSTPLGIDGVFTGDWIDTTNYSQAIINIIIDQDAAINGFRIEYSDNASDIIHVHTFSPLINTPNGHHYPATLDSQYFRIKYTNGSTEQSSFRIVTTLFPDPSEDGHVHPVEGTIDGDHPAPIRRTVLVAKRADTDYDNIQSTNGNNLKVSIEEANGEVNPVRADIEANGYVTIGITAVELTYIGITNTIILTSKITNTGTIWIGKSNVTNTGANSLISIEAGESISMRYDDVDNALYAVSDVASQRLLKGAVL